MKKIAACGARDRSAEHQPSRAWPVCGEELAEIAAPPPQTLPSEQENRNLRAGIRPGFQQNRSLTSNGMPAAEEIPNATGFWLARGCRALAIGVTTIPILPLATPADAWD